MQQICIRWWKANVNLNLQKKLTQNFAAISFRIFDIFVFNAPTTLSIL